MSKKKESLHILIAKDDFQLINAFSPNHGDRTKLVCAIISSWCKEIRKGKVFQIPEEIQLQLDENAKAEQPEFPVDLEDSDTNGKD